MRPLRTLLVLLPLLLSGCTFPSGDALLAAPKTSANYQNLQAELEELIAAGAAYTSPTKGENRSSIQLRDLDNDGVEEAVSFFRGATTATSNNFAVYVYKKQDDRYVCTGSVESKGTEIVSVEYPAITPDGRRGMAITWRLTGDGTGALTLCDFDEDCAPRVLLETEYAAMELTDMDSDGAKDLVLIATDPTGKRMARLYQYHAGKLTLTGEAATSPETTSVERMVGGRVQLDRNAVFAEEKMASGIGLTTDIFVYEDGTLLNLALGGENSISRSTYRPVSVYATDINNDGVIELPRAVLMAGYTDASAADAVFMLDWYAYHVGSPPEVVMTTYKSISDGWSLAIDEAWHDTITATKGTDNGLSMVVFSEYQGGAQQIPLFTIYCAAGSAREYYAGRADLIQLGQTTQAVYFARLAPEAGSGTLQITADDIRSRFSLAKQAWND